MSYVTDRPRAVKMNEVRGRFISALRQYNLTGVEFRIVIALNELYNPKQFKAWPRQVYLCEVLADVTTGRPMPERTLRRGIRGLEKKGIVETKEVRLSREHSKLEYRLAYDKVIGCDPGYHKSRDRGPVGGIQMLVSPDILVLPTGHSGPVDRTKVVTAPDQSGRLSSLGSSLGDSIGNSLAKDSLNLKEERKGESEEDSKGSSEVVKETKAERSLREFRERLAARKKRVA
jgi:hypothetical protein